MEKGRENFVKNDFARIITLLRKERGLSQKQVALDLNISQALLSHYEKGIRECGLDFLLSIADYYDVSCDYLLGKTSERTGTILNMLKEDNNINDDSNTSCETYIENKINKAIIINSINIIYGLLETDSNKELNDEISNYIMVLFYNLFRRLYSGNLKNLQGLFSADKNLYKTLASASECLPNGKIDILVKKIATTNDSNFHITRERIMSEYPNIASSLYTLIQMAESRIEKINNIKN